jgi:hypothetical protein
LGIIQTDAHLRLLEIISLAEVTAPLDAIGCSTFMRLVGGELLLVGSQLLPGTEDLLLLGNDQLLLLEEGQVHLLLLRLQV